MNEVSWLTAKDFFALEAKAEWCGYQARLSCSATAMLHQALVKLGWLNTIFDKVVEESAHTSHVNVPGASRRAW